MAMHIELSGDVEEFIRRKVASGTHGNAIEVISDAVRQMRAEEERMSAWRAAIKIGEDQIDAGEGVPFTSELMDELQRRALEAAESGRPLNPDVLP